MSKERGHGSETIHALSLTVLHKPTVTQKKTTHDLQDGMSRTLVLGDSGLCCCVCVSSFQRLINSLVC